MKIEHKTAYIAAGATVAAALIASVVPLVFNVESKPRAAIENGSNNNIVQGAAGDVRIDQRINELGAIREASAKAMKQGLVSGCRTMESYFVDDRAFDVDSLDTLIGDVWTQKQEFISYYGAEPQRQAMEIVDAMNPYYLDYIVGAEWFNKNRTAYQTQEDRDYSVVDERFRAMMDGSKPDLVAYSAKLCTLFERLEIKPEEG